jgi:hypothetical protein
MDGGRCIFCCERGGAGIVDHEVAPRHQKRLNAMSLAAEFATKQLVDIELVNDHPTNAYVTRQRSRLAGLKKSIPVV